MLQREEIQRRILEITDNPHALIDLNEEIAFLKERQRQRYFGKFVNATNFLAKNITENYAAKGETTMNKMIAQNERIFDAQAKKEEMEIEKHKMKVFLLHKWSIIRCKKKQYEEEMYVRNQKEQRNFGWHQLINMDQMVRFIFTKFNDIRWNIRLN